jgi:hypothetical protein
MSALLVVTSLLEAVTGLALLLSPALLVSLLLGASLDTSTEWVLARVAGAALLSIDVVCWLARNDRTMPNGFARLQLRRVVTHALFRWFAGYTAASSAHDAGAHG